MNNTFNCRDYRDTTRRCLDAAAPGGCRSGRPRLQRGRPRTSAGWAWLLVLVAVAGLAANGCGGGGAEPESGPEQPPAMEPGPPPGAAPPKPKPKEAAKLEEGEPLPEEVSEWVRDDYYQARRARDPRLPEAVAYLGEHFAGTENADEAAVLLTNLLKKSEEPEPKRAAGPPSGYPGMGPGAMPSGYPGPEGGPPTGYPGPEGGPPTGYPGPEEAGMVDEGEVYEPDDMYQGGYP